MKSAMQPFTRLSGAALVLSAQNIDTDQIIPARFLTTTRFEGLGAHAFADWRFDAAGRPLPGCVLNEPRALSSPILVAGRNFGCGSSREHAPRALLDFGFRVVIAAGIADIFRNNSQNVGLLPVVLEDAQMEVLLGLDGHELSVDLETCTVSGLDAEGRAFNFPFRIDGFARYCLLQGMDRLDFLLAETPAIERFEVRHESQDRPAAR